MPDCPMIQFVPGPLFPRSPLGVEDAVLVSSAVGVGPKIIALCLGEIRRKTFAAVGVVISQGGCHG